MFKKSFRLKVILPSVLILLALVVSLNVFLSLRFSTLNNSLINAKFETNINSLHFFLDDNRAHTITAAVSMSYNSNAIKAIRERDTGEILRVFAPAHDQYKVDFFTISDHEGMVLARTHDPDNFGDSILYQLNIKGAINGEVSTQFEPGTVVRVSVRTAAPVFDSDGSMIGIVLAGVRFDLDSELEKLKELFNSEIAIFSGETRIAATIAKDGQSIAGASHDAEIMEYVINNRSEFRGEMEVGGEKYKTYYKPIMDSRNRVFAVFFFGMPTTSVIRASSNVSRDGIVFGFIGLAISAIIIFFVMSSISEPIIILSKNMHNIADGNLRVDIKVKSDDEVGDLGRSLQKIAFILFKLLGDIHTMISEQKKGNTDFYFKTEEFHGDFRVLADSVIELASYSMKDQLTGIPNRRSFDNRLDLEWERAIREKDPISILMIDVDKFKTYNDTFGHQQGDAALKTVSAAIKQSLNRSTDFTARWGGEEFIVLLPNTDSSGAVSIAERIRVSVENADIPCNDDQGRKVTISIGISSGRPEKHTKVSDFILNADDALFKAKKAGRNRVHQSTP